MLEAQFHHALVDECRVVQGQRILVGFSGGADSLCLLHLLRSQPVEVVAAHFNHRLRSEADSDAAACRKLAAEWSIRYIEETAPVGEIARKMKLSIEEAARVLRYRFLFASARSVGADAVAVAHHADDQVETVLMHLLRGVGTAGLAGMQFRTADPLGESSIPLVRPLLGIWRWEIRQYMLENDLVPLEDATNSDPAYIRNRIRIKLVPELETYNPEFKRHLAQTASIVGEENAWLEAETGKKLARLILGSGDFWRLVDVSSLRDEPHWLIRRLVRKVIFSLKSNLRDVSFAEVERAVAYLQHPDYRKFCQVTNEIEIFRYDQGSILFAAQDTLLFDLWPQLSATDPVMLLPGSTYFIPGGWELKLERQFGLASTPPTENPWECLIDENRLDLPLSLGVRKPGGTFIPFGMGGKSLKLGDFFTNAHLPVRARDAWPLVYSGGRIAWVPGYRVAEFCRVNPQTRNVLRLTLTQIKKKPA